MSYINNSKQVVEEAFQTGTAVLANMSGQRERLKVDQHQAPVHSTGMLCFDAASSQGVSMLNLECRQPKQRPWMSSTA